MLRRIHAFFNRPRTLILAILATYAIFPIQTLSFQHDALLYLNTIVAFLGNPDTPLTHPHHMLTMAFYVGIAKGIHALWPDMSLPAVALAAMRYGNIACTGLALLGFQWVSERTLGVKPMAQCWMLVGMGFSFLIWSYASSAELYQPSLACFAWVLFFLFLPSTPWRVGMMVLLTVGMLSLHLMSIGLVLAVLFALRHTPRRLVSYSLGSGFGVLGVYGLPLLQLKTWDAVVGWLMPAGGPLGFSLLHSFLHIPIGLGRSFFGLAFVFANTDVYQWVSRVLLGRLYLIDDVFLVQGTSHAQWWASFLMWGAAVVAMGAVVWVAAKSLRRVSKNEKVRTLLLCLGGSFSVVVLSRDSHNEDLYVYIVCVFFVLLGVLFDKVKQPLLFWSAVVLMGVSNYSGAIRYLQDPTRDLFRQTAMAVAALPADGRPVVLDLQRNYAPYLTFYGISRHVLYLSDVDSLRSVGQDVWVSHASLVSTAYMQQRYPETSANLQQLAAWGLGDRIPKTPFVTPRLIKGVTP